MATAFGLKRDSQGVWTLDPELLICELLDLDNFGTGVGIDGDFAIVGPTGNRNGHGRLLQADVLERSDQLGWLKTSWPSIAELPSSYKLSSSGEGVGLTFDGQRQNELLTGTFGPGAWF